MMDAEATPVAENSLTSDVMDDGAAIFLDNIPLKLSVVLGSVAMPMRDVARLRPGSLVTLDRRIDQPVEIVINDRVVCKGEISVTEETQPRFVFKIIEFVEASASASHRA